MSSKTWWKRQKSWVKGGLMGMLLGLTIYILSIGLLILQLIELSEFFWNIGALLFCKFFNLDLGEDCAFVYLFYGWLFLIVLYGLIGLISGFLFEKIKK